MATAMCTSFKQELAQAVHNFTTTTGGAYSILLIKTSPARSYDATQTNVGTPGSGTPSAANVGTDETSGPGYTTGGFTWTAAQNTTPTTSGTTAFWSWSINPSWSAASFSTTAAVIYKASGGNAVGTFDLGTQSIVSGTLTLVLPTVNSSLAILRIA